MFTILVPLDGSALAEQALPFAIHLADTVGARLVVTRVARAAVVRGTGPNDAVGAVTEAEFYLQAIADRLHCCSAASPKRSCARPMCLFCWFHGVRRSRRRLTSRPASRCRSTAHAWPRRPSIRYGTGRCGSMPPW